MMAFASVPPVMREEVVAAVLFIKALVNRYHQLNPKILEVFGERLAEILGRKYTGRWYVDKPKKGQAYRCIRISRQDRDLSILEACTQCGLNYADLALPQEMTLWINPNDVSVWAGEEYDTYAVAIYESGTSFVQPELNIMMGQQDPSRADTSSTPPPNEDSSHANSSPPSSPSAAGGDSDSGNGGSSKDTCTPPASCSPREENIWWPYTVEPVTQDSTALYEVPSPFWFPARRSMQFYQGINEDPSELFLL